jgi:hypothetical protein
MRPRPVATTLPAGDAVAHAPATPDADAAHNLETTDAIWSALDAHDAVAVMAPAAADYVYEDFAAPAPLDKPRTQAMVASFLSAVANFTIAAKPVHFAAGADVITEMVEHLTIDGRPITLHALDIKRFAAGHVVREWQYANGAETMTQLFALPPPPLF